MTSIFSIRGKYIFVYEVHFMSAPSLLMLYPYRIGRMGRIKENFFFVTSLIIVPSSCRTWSPCLGYRFSRTNSINAALAFLHNFGYPNFTHVTTNCNNHDSNGNGDATCPMMSTATAIAIAAAVTATCAIITTWLFRTGYNYISRLPIPHSVLQR